MQDVDESVSHSQQTSTRTSTVAIQKPEVDGSVSCTRMSTGASIVATKHRMSTRMSAATTKRRMSMRTSAVATNRRRLKGVSTVATKRRMSTKTSAIASNRRRSMGASAVPGITKCEHQLPERMRQLRCGAPQLLLITKRAYSSPSACVSSGVGHRSCSSSPSMHTAPRAHTSTPVWGAAAAPSSPRHVHSSTQIFGAQKTYLQSAINREPQSHSGSPRSSPGHFVRRVTESFFLL